MNDLTPQQRKMLEALSDAGSTLLPSGSFTIMTAKEWQRRLDSGEWAEINIGLNSVIDGDSDDVLKLRLDGEDGGSNGETS